MVHCLLPYAHSPAGISVCAVLQAPAMKQGRTSGLSRRHCMSRGHLSWPQLLAVLPGSTHSLTASAPVQSLCRATSVPVNWPTVRLSRPGFRGAPRLWDTPALDACCLPVGLLLQAALLDSAVDKPCSLSVTVLVSGQKAALPCSLKASYMDTAASLTSDCRKTCPAHQTGTGLLQKRQAADVKVACLAKRKSVYIVEFDVQASTGGTITSRGHQIGKRMHKLGLDHTPLLVLHFEVRVWELQRTGSMRSRGRQRPGRYQTNLRAWGS